MLGDTRGYSHLKEEALDRIKWRNRFGRGRGPVVWQITDDDDDVDQMDWLRVRKAMIKSSNKGKVEGKGRPRMGHEGQKGE